MADLALTAAQIGVVHPGQAEVYDYIAAVAITKGQAVYINSDGKAALVDGSAAGTAGYRGVALEAAAAEVAVSVILKGAVYGFTLSQAYDADIYVSDTAGALADAAGTVSVLVGRVMPLTDSTITKVLYLVGVVG